MRAAELDPSQFLLHEQFDRQASSTPERVALHGAGRSITYAGLKARSDEVAASLRTRGIGAGCSVGLHIERSIEHVASMLAILKTNSAVVPLPPTYPERRLRDILSFSGLDAVVDDDATPLPTGLSDRVLHFSNLTDEGDSRGGATAGSPDQPAFVLCSSGSTGTPKMIVRSHRSFFHRLHWTWENHPYVVGEACCQKAHMTTTHAIYELFEPLLRGTPVHIVSDQDARSLEAFWEAIRARAISRLLIVPSALRASLDMPGFVAPAIKVLVLMGEYVHPRLAQRAMEAFPDSTRIFSIYGSTEASSTLVCDLKESLRAGEELPLGRPIAEGVQAHVLGADLRQASPGETGTLHITGPALFSEYFRNPALTASVFVDPPQGGPRAYDTHDQVRRMPDGQLQFVGRADDTVKIRGFRVDLQEVERALLLHPDVRQGAVVLDDRDPSSARLIAFVAPDTIDQSTVYALLREHLPAYMVPSVVAGRRSFPLTASGKVDRRALLEDLASRAPVVSRGRRRTETEQRVVEIWERVLKRPDVPLDRSFFEIGGTSLTVFATVHHLRTAFELDRSQLTDQSIYRFPTVEALASYIDGAKSGNALPARPNDSLLVVLKKGEAVDHPPFFVIASAGGTLGAYEKLARVLDTRRDVIGVRDPFIWGERDPTEGFQRWVARYLDAIRERQPQGPYYIAGYSSAASFAFEIARRLRQDRQEVALLTLIEPLAIDCGSNRRFGYWALRARFTRRSLERVVLAGGWLRSAALRLTGGGSRSHAENDTRLTAEQFQQLAADARRNKRHIANLSALIELNSGLSTALTYSELSQVDPAEYVALLLDRVNGVAPEIDPAAIENIVVQYELQVRTQHAYQLQGYDGKTVIFEAEGPYNGLLSVQFSPHVRALRVVALKLGPQAERTRALSESFPGRIWTHYRCMRDDEFVKELAGQLGALLR